MEPARVFDTGFHIYDTDGTLPVLWVKGEQNPRECRLFGEEWDKISDCTIGQEEEKEHASSTLSYQYAEVIVPSPIADVIIFAFFVDDKHLLKPFGDRSQYNRSSEQGYENSMREM